MMKEETLEIKGEQEFCIALKIIESFIYF